MYSSTATFSVRSSPSSVRNAGTWPRELMRYTRKVDVLLALAGPLLFFYALDVFDTRQLAWQRGSLRFYLAPYVVVCWIFGFGIAPICEIFYLLRRRAPQLVEEKSETVDVAKELGYSLNGHGKDAKLCNLPLNQCFQVEFTEKTLALPGLV